MKNSAMICASNAAILFYEVSCQAISSKKQQACCFVLTKTLRRGHLGRLVRSSLPVDAVKPQVLDVEQAVDVPEGRARLPHVVQSASVRFLYSSQLLKRF